MTSRQPVRCRFGTRITFHVKPCNFKVLCVDRARQIGCVLLPALFPATIPLRAPRANDAALYTQRGQAGVGIAGPQPKPVFGTRRQHPIGFRDTLQGQIVEHDRNVGICAIKIGDLTPEDLSGGMHSGNKPLRRRFLITGGSVYLACAVEPRDGMQFQCRTQSPRVDMVIFDGIAGHTHLDPLQPLHRTKHTKLDIDRKRGGDSVGVDEIGVQPLWFEEDLVPLSIAEPVNLVLDRRAIARPCGIDRSGEQR